MEIIRTALNTQADWGKPAYTYMADVKLAQKE